MNFVLAVLAFLGYRLLNRAGCPTFASWWLRLLFEFRAHFPLPALQKRTITNDQSEG